MINITLLTRILQEYDTIDISWDSSRKIAMEAAIAYLQKATPANYEDIWKVYIHALRILWQLHEDIDYMFACKKCHARFTCICKMKHGTFSGRDCFPHPVLPNISLHQLFILNKKISLVANVVQLKNVTASWTSAKLQGSCLHISKAQTDRSSIFVEDTSMFTLPIEDRFDSCISTGLSLDQLLEELHAWDNPIYRHLDYAPNASSFLFTEQEDVTMRILESEMPGLLRQDEYFSKAVPAEIFTRYLLKRGTNTQALTRFMPCYLPTLFPVLFMSGDDNYHLHPSRFATTDEEREGNRLSDYFNKEELAFLEEVEVMSEDVSDSASEEPQDEEVNDRPRLWEKNERWTPKKFFKWAANAFPELVLGPMGNIFIAELYDTFMEQTLKQVTKVMINTQSLRVHDRRNVLVTSSTVGTPPYWKKKEQELEAIAAEKGAPHLFVTATFNETWPEAKKYRLTDLIYEDPLAMNFIFLQRLNTLITALKDNKAFPMLSLDVYWTRIEFQKRGAPHAHMLLWFKDWPHENTERWRALIDSIISTSFDKPELYLGPLPRNGYNQASLDRLSAWKTAHTHVHSANYCQKNGPCRFKFPLEPIDETYERNGTVFLKRKMEDAWIVEHSPALLKIWEGHINVKPISSFTDYTYLVAYNSKSEPVDAVPVEFTTNGVLYESHRVFMKGRIVSVPEMAWILMGYPLCITNVSFCRISVLPSALRWRVIGPDGLFKDNKLDLYFKRPEICPRSPINLHQLGIKEFFQNFDIKVCKGELRVTQRSKQCIVRLPVPSIHSVQSYWYYRIALSRAFSTDQELDNLCMTDEGVNYEHWALQNIATNQDILEDTLFRWITADRPPITQMRRYLLNSIYDPSEWTIIRQRVLNALNIDIGSILEARRSAATYIYMQGDPTKYTQLTEEQRSICDELLSLRRSAFIEGAAGTGKSFLITALIGKLTELGLKVSLVAPTGVAAFNVKGATIHSQFRISTDTEWCNLEEEPELTDYIGSLDVLIIDEISMVNIKLFECMHRLFQHVKASEDFFGSIQVICIGDFCQLPPVSAGNASLNNTPLFSYLYRYKLQQLIRCQCMKLKSVLNQVNRHDVVTAQLRTELSGFIWHSSIPIGLFHEFITSDRLCMLITPLRASKQLLTTQLFSAVATSPMNFAKKLYANKITIVATGRQRETRTLFWVGERVVFTKTIDAANGAINGALAKVLELKEFSVVVEIISTKQRYIVSYSSTKDQIKQAKALVAVRIRSIPLEQAYFGTIHRCQGLTLDRVIIDVRTPHFSHGMLYTAISRAKLANHVEFVGDLNTLSFFVDPTIVDKDEISEIPSQRTEREIYILGIRPN